MLTLQNYLRLAIWKFKLLKIKLLVSHHLARGVLGPSAESGRILGHRFDNAIVFALHNVSNISVLVLFVGLERKSLSIVVLTAL